MFGFIKIAAAVPSVLPADCVYNGKKIAECISKASAQGVKLLVFPELAISGYTCGDLFFQPRLIEACEKEMCLLKKQSAEHDIALVIGAPVLACGGLYNCAVVIHGGHILGIVPKQILAEGSQFNENRWFRPGDNIPLFSITYCGADIPFGNIIFKCLNYEHFSFAAEICADLYSVVPPSCAYSIMGATVIANLSASPNYAGKAAKRAEIVKQQSDRCICAYIYASSAIGESSADSVYDGHAIIAEQGIITAQSRRYSDENEIITHDADIESAVYKRAKTGEFKSSFGIDIKTVAFRFKEEDCKEPDFVIPKRPYLPAHGLNDFYAEIINIQTFGLYKRLKATGINTVIIGVSGGLDSTLALLVAANCHDKLSLPRKNIIGITMPGFGTSSKTHKNAVGLMKELDVSFREISIVDACTQHFKDIGHSLEVRNTTFENAQARERTQILMDIANTENGLVIGTGDMSELALGWATYNGDHMSMYGVNSGVPKTIIRALIGKFAEDNSFGNIASGILRSILDTPVSPELLPADSGGGITQITEDLVGPYELHDYFMYCIVNKGFSPEKTAWLAKRSFDGIYDAETVLKWLNVFIKRFFSQQFKRSCSPDGPKAIEFALSQRTDLKMPSDISGYLWKFNNMELR